MKTSQVVGTNNPWNLTPSQIRVMDAYIKHGSHKATARALDCEVKHVENMVLLARDRMGVDHRIQQVIEYDRWKRQEQAAINSIAKA